MTVAQAGRDEPVDGFPHDDFLGMLRQVRHELLVGDARQRALLGDLRIPARAVLGHRGEAPVLPGRAAGPTAPSTITAPVMADVRSATFDGLRNEDDAATSGDDEAPVRPDAGEVAAEATEEGVDPVEFRLPAPTPDPAVSSASGGGGAEIARSSGPSTGMGPEGFARALLAVVSTPEHLDAAVVLARRAHSELPAAQQPVWDVLLERLDHLQVENRRRALEQGRSPDLASLTDWVGFECLHHYSLTDRFFGRDAYLARLDAWVDDHDGPSITCLTALGGAGKSALAWRWLNGALTRLRADGFRGALWCSFYEGTFKFEDFLRRALTFCGRTSREGVDELSRGQVEEQLVEALRHERFVLVVDGLERLMVGYAQAAERAIDDEGTRSASDRSGATHEDRRMSERRDGAFLARLATRLESRVLITTRLLPADLQLAREDALRGHVGLIDLPGLDSADAVALWSSILPDTPVDEEIAEILEMCGYHPLAISILARSVAASDGGWLAWREAEAHRDFAPLGTTAQVRAHVIETCLHDLTADAQDVLNLLAVTGKPMQHDEVASALRQGSIDFGNERWTAPDRVSTELRGLIGLGLVGEAVVDGVAEYDLHPVVRGVVWGLMTDPRRASDRRVVLDRALSELAAVPDPQLAAEPVYVDKAASIFALLVSTGQADRAWETLRSKLWWPLFERGAHRELLDLFEQLLPRRDPLQLLPLASRREQADAAESLGGLLMHVGDTVVADLLLVWTGVIRLRINDLIGFLDVRHQQTWQALYTGALFDAVVALRQVKVQAGAMGVPELFSTVNPWIGLSLALCGRREEARTYLAVDVKDAADRRWWVQGAAEGHLYLGEHAEALRLLGQLPDDEVLDPRQQSWEQLTRGMAELGVGELDRAEESLELALHTARRLDYSIVQCFALVSLAEIAVRRERWPDVEDLLRQYFRLDGDSRYRLTAGDAWRLRALSAEARGDRAAALAHAAVAYRTAVCDGPPFTYADGVRRAREVLERLGAYVPRTSNSLPPTWHSMLDRVTADETRIDELTTRSKPLTIAVRLDPHDLERRQRARTVVRRAAADDRRWFDLVAGTDPTLTVSLSLALVDLGISVADLRRLFESSAEKSLEVVITRLFADRLLEPATPTPFATLAPPERTEWLSRTDEHERALDEFLTSELARTAEHPFLHQGLDGRGIQAFTLDCRRRIDVEGAGADARGWWSELEKRRDPWDMLVLAECIQAAGAALDEFLDAISVTGTRGLEYGFLSLREKRAIAALHVTAVSRTDGWLPFELQLRLQTVKYQLGWLELDDPVRAFWTGIEERNAQKPALVLRLAEELALRGSSIPAYHEACLHSSDPEDPMATLAYLDYVRLARIPWKDGAWPDDVSVQRWSYDTATPTFRDLHDWTDEQIARLLEAERERIAYSDAPARARGWWDTLGSTVPGATMVRVIEELRARRADVAEFYRAHVDAGSDNLLAVLSYLDFIRLARRGLSDDETVVADSEVAAGNRHFAATDYEAAARSYEAAITADPTRADAHLDLALTVEQLDEGVAGRSAAEVLERGIESCPDDAGLRAERRRLALGLPRFPAPRSPIVVELSEPLVHGMDDLLQRVEVMRERVRRTVGMPFGGILFLRNDGLAAGAYRVLLDDVLVAHGTTVPGHLFVPAPGVEEHPVWPAVRGRPDGEWRAADDTGAGLTPHTCLLRHLQTVLAAVAPRMLTEQIVYNLVEVEGWSATPLDLAADLLLLASFTEVLQTLLDEQVPITDVEALMDEYRALRRAGVSTSGAVARLRLLPTVRRGLPGNRAGDVLLRLDAGAEQLLASAAIDDRSGALLLDPRVTHDVLREIRAVVKNHRWDGGHDVRAVLLVADAALRHRARLLLRAEFPALPVVAAAELLPGAAR